MHPTKSSVKLTTVPAPIGGLNARDSIANMPATDAITLTNWIPDSYGVRCRKGYLEWAINFPGNKSVDSLLPYFVANSGFPGGGFLTDPSTMPGKLFAATDTAIYDVTSKTNAPTLAVALSGAPGAGWLQSVMLISSGGSFLLAASEVDGYFTYDGTTWVHRVAGAGAGQINGVNPNGLVHVSLWKRRAWFVEKNTTKAWYLPVDSIAGVATAFDFGPLFKRGGSLAYTSSWTIDAGEGIDDFFVAVSSNGEVLVYKGSDPASGTTFALVGVWPVGQIPVGRRAYTQYGGDLIIISTDGVSPLSAVTRGGSVMLTATNKEYSSKIRPLIGEALRKSFTSNGWDLTLHPSERLLLCNTPVNAGAKDSQFVMSTSMNEWCTFSGIPSVCYGSTAGYTFAGTANGKVLLLFTSFVDNVAYGASTGSAVLGTMVPAFNYFDSPSQKKQFLMARPGFVAENPPGVLADIVVDFAPSAPMGTPSYGTVTTSNWNIATWNSGVWGGSKLPYAEWVTVSGLGNSGALGLITQCIGDTTLTSIDYMYQAGGPF